MQTRPSLPLLPIPQKRFNRLSQITSLPHQTERAQFSKYLNVQHSPPRALALSQTSRIPTPSSQLSQTYMIKIEIQSNYGNENEISCSEIDVLDDHNRLLHIDDIRFMPQINHKTSPQFLINSCLIKESSDLEWTAIWNHTPFSILLVITSSQKPSSLRIWNSQRKDGANIQSIKIYNGYTYLTSVTIPMNFGSVISLSALEKSPQACPDLFILQETSKLIDEVAVDCYGEIPLLLIESVRVEILETINSISRYVGLNAVEFYYPSGKQMNYQNEISHVHVEHMEALSSPQRLFRSNRSASTNLGNGFFGAKRSHTYYPAITIYFRWPLPICLFILANAQVMNISDKEIGIKKMKITAHSKGKDIIYYFGYFGNNKYNPQTDEIQKYVWFVDSAPIQAKILGQIHLHQKEIALSREKQESNACIPLSMMHNQI